MKCLFAFLLTASILPAAAVQPYQPVPSDPLLEPWRWRTFPDLSGLGLQCIAEAEDGVLWFGMSDGAWTFNGVDWNYQSSVFVGSGGGVIGFKNGADGALLCLRRAGIAQRRDGEWTHLFPPSYKAFGDLRRMIVGRDGAIWTSSAWGLLHFRDSKWTLHTSPEIASELRSNRNHPQIELRVVPDAILKAPRDGGISRRRIDFNALAEDRQGRIWIGNDAGEIICFDPAADSKASGAAPAWSIYNETNGLICGRSPSILAAQDGSIWVVYGTGSGHANVFDGNTWKAIRLADVGAPDDIGELMQTRDGVIWLSARYIVCTWNKGQWRSYQQPEVPIPTARNYLMQTKDGALWIAGPATEIARIDYQTRNWESFKDLNFQWESPAGDQWFLHRLGRIVVRDPMTWSSYGVEDGLIDTPVGLTGTRDGVVWVAGSHSGTAATARFENGKWTRFVHSDFAWGIDWRGIFISSDGSAWFSAAVDSNGPKEHRNGILQYRNGRWIHHHQPGRAPTGDNTNLTALLPATQRPEPIGKFLSIAESRDGRIWAGRNLLAFQDSSGWHLMNRPTNLHWGIIETLFTTRAGDMWVGTRQHGALRYDGKDWHQYQGKGSLVANTARSFAETDDGSLWVATDRDMNHFDGMTWTPDVLPSAMVIPNEAGSLKASPGHVWINHFAADWVRRGWTKGAPINASNCIFWTVGHFFKDHPPETFIKAGSKTVSQPGSLSIFWGASVPWRAAKDTRLQFSFRLDGEAWSPFTFEQGHSFFTLPSGPHRFEVRARDQDFNIDPTPAVLEFVVLPAVWKQGWFIALMSILGGLVLAQSFRVFLERAQLRRANRALEAEVHERERAEQELKHLNQELDQRVKARTNELEVANKELEAFSYSVSHDLRAPLRSIDGFSRALLEDYFDKLDPDGKEDLQSVRAASQRMGQLIDDMLMLARVTRSEIRPETTDLSEIATVVIGELQKNDPNRRVECRITPGLTAQADPRLMRIVLENLIGNAWKFTGRKPDARIEFGRALHEGKPAFFVRDNGVGFDMTYAQKLFGAFQRLHTVTEFPGTGIGLATVQRIIHRQGGRIWAQSTPDEGATFFFTLPEHPGKQA